MSEDRRTKAQILEELETAQQQISRLEAAMPMKPRDVPEATALAACIRALDALRGSFESFATGSGREVEEVLRHLTRRYGVDFTERIVEPCERAHISATADEMTRQSGLYS